MKKRSLQTVIAAALVITMATGVPVINGWSVSAAQAESSVQSVTVSPKTLTLEVGKTSKLSASVAPANAKDQTVTWSTSDAKIASVDKQGTVTAKAAGEATITATAGGKTASCTVTVNKVVVPETLTAGSDGVADDNKVRAMLEDQKGARPVIKLQSGSVKVSAGVLKDVLKENSKIQEITFAVKGSKPYTITYTRAQIKEIRSKKDLCFDVSISETTKKSGSVITFDVKEIPSKISPKMKLTVSESFANKTLELYADDMLVAKDLKVKRSSTPVVAGAYRPDAEPVVAAANKTSKAEKPSKPAKTYYYSVDEIPISSGEYELRVVKSGDNTSTGKAPLLDSKEVQMAVDGTYQFLVKGNQDTKNLKVSVSDPKVASVKLKDRNDSRGARYEVTAKAVGKTEVQVTYKGASATMKVEVKPAGTVPTIYSRGSITLDTAQYKMAPGNQYTIGSVIRNQTGKELTAAEMRGLVTSGHLKVYDSRTGSVAQLEQLPTGNFQVTGKNPGTCYIVYEIGGTHASIRIDVQKGIRARGSAVRNTSYFTR